MTTWIFQGNPDVFRVDEYLKSRKTIRWAIRQKHLKDEISVGDKVFIWRSDGGRQGSGGIVAKGKIAAPPEDMEDDVPELWIKPQGATTELRVVIELEDVRLSEEEGMLKRVDLKGDPQLSSMRILKVPLQTNYKLEPAHAQRIEQLWQQKRKG